jgi:hypothetical protein
VKQCVYSGSPQNEAGWQVLLTLTSPTQPIPITLKRKELTMQEDPITDNETENIYPDPVDWQIAFEPYEGNPEAALTLGYRLTELKQLIRELDMHEALQEIEVALDCLYEHSDFRSISRELFGTAIQGKLTTDKETLLRQLGLRI